MPSSPIMRFLVLVLVAVLCTPVTVAVPNGCSVNGTQLTSCSGFTGTTLDLQDEGLTSIQSGAFDGLTSLTNL